MSTPSELVLRIRTEADLKAAEAAQRSLQTAIKSVREGTPAYAALKQQLDSVNASLGSQAGQAARAAGEMQRAIASVKAPPGNWVGQTILRRLLEKALAELLIPPGVVMSFDLNRAVCVVSVSNRPAALEAIIAELEAVALLGVAHLVWFDEREAIWRTHPDGRAGSDLPKEAYASEEFAAAVKAAHQTIIAAIQHARLEPPAGPT